MPKKKNKRLFGRLFKRRSKKTKKKRASPERPDPEPESGNAIEKRASVRSEASDSDFSSPRRRSTRQSIATGVEKAYQGLGSMAGELGSGVTQIFHHREKFKISDSHRKEKEGNFALLGEGDENLEPLPRSERKAIEKEMIEEIHQVEMNLAICKDDAAWEYAKSYIKKKTKKWLNQHAGITDKAIYELTCFLFAKHASSGSCTWLETVNRRLLDEKSFQRILNTNNNLIYKRLCTAVDSGGNSGVSLAFGYNPITDDPEAQPNTRVSPGRMSLVDPLLSPPKPGQTSRRSMVQQVLLDLLIDSEVEINSLNMITGSVERGNYWEMKWVLEANFTHSALMDVFPLFYFLRKSPFRRFT